MKSIGAAHKERERERERVSARLGETRITKAHGQQALLSHIATTAKIHT